MKYLKISKTSGISGRTTCLYYHQLKYRDATKSMAQYVIYLFTYSQMPLKMAMACVPILDSLRQWNCKMFVFGWKVKELTSEADFHSQA